MRKENITMTATMRTTIGVHAPTGATSRIFTDRPIMIRFIPALILSTVIHSVQAMDSVSVPVFRSEDLITGARSLITGTAIMTHSRMAMGTVSRTAMGMGLGMALAADTDTGRTTGAAITIM
ncbi:MAG: hypothetical protein BMS9Abin05_2407 [Rhodothermia bacterium]|nr:MAG: hypothetical protein BMS9Abin05_2407 [Rhodothermia bacterium]